MHGDRSCSFNCPDCTHEPERDSIAGLHLCRESFSAACKSCVSSCDMVLYSTVQYTTLTGRVPA